MGSPFELPMVSWPPDGFTIRAPNGLLAPLLVRTEFGTEANRHKVRHVVRGLENLQALGDALQAHLDLLCGEDAIPEGPLGGPVLVTLVVQEQP